jgi:hypothetical protein
MFGKLFGKKSTSQNTKEAASQFDTAKNKFIEIIIKGLSDPDQRERQGCANLIRDKVVPALEIDLGGDSRKASLQTLSKLMSELRPPNGSGEMNDLNNAAFHYMRLQLMQQSK